MAALCGILTACRCLQLLPCWPVPPPALPCQQVHGSCLQPGTATTPGSPTGHKLCASQANAIGSIDHQFCKTLRAPG